MNKKEKIAALESLGRMASQLREKSFSLSHALEMNHDLITDRLANEFAHTASATFKILAELLEPKGFAITFTEPTIDSSFLDAAAKEAIAEGKQFE